MNVQTDEALVIENKENFIPIIIVDTSEDAVEDEYLDRIKAYDAGILVLSDKLIVSSNIFQVRKRWNLLWWSFWWEYSK